MKYNPFPLHPSQIRSADPGYPLDLLPETQEILQRRAEQTHPTMATTSGRPAWRWGRPTDGPRGSSAPVIFSPSMLEKAPAEQSDDQPADLRTKFGTKR